MKKFLKHSFISRKIPEIQKPDAKDMLNNYRQNNYSAIMPILLNGNIAILGRVQKKHQYLSISFNNGDFFVEKQVSEKYRLIYYDKNFNINNISLSKSEQKILAKKLKQF